MFPFLFSQIQKYFLQRKNIIVFQHRRNFDPCDSLQIQRNSRYHQIKIIQIHGLLQLVSGCDCNDPDIKIIFQLLRQKTGSTDPRVTHNDDSRLLITLIIPFCDCHHVEQDKCQIILRTGISNPTLQHINIPLHCLIIHRVCFLHGFPVFILKMDSFPVRLRNIFQMLFQLIRSLHIFT